MEIGDLTEGDFRRHHVWGFDLSLEGEGYSESVVRPYSFRSIPEETDWLFVSARIQTPNGEWIQGVIQFRFHQGSPCDVRRWVLVAPGDAGGSVPYEFSLDIAGDVRSYSGVIRLA